MKKDRVWKVLSEGLRINGNGLKIENLINLLLENRGLKTKKEIDEFLNPKLENITSESVGIDKKQVQLSVKRINDAIKNNEEIVVYGDYDTDGVTGAAIIWETLHSLGAKITPFIPDRVTQGYGLSRGGIEALISKLPNLKLIITVDNGIVANEAVDFANSKNIDVIITDHHVRSEKDPKAFSIFHTIKLCGAGVGYMLSQEVIRSTKDKNAISNVPTDHLSLVALATVADLVPLIGANRTVLKFGLQQLKKTSRPGLLALLRFAGIEKENIDPYVIGHVIAPRINAMGRLDSAMDSLRLLCTKDKTRALVLADKLNRTNKERQDLTISLSEHAISKVKSQKSKVKNLLFVAHEDYDEGVIGLIASNLVEEFYLPAIVVSKKNGKSKASARSISGFNIIEFIRQSQHLLINAGGHPMAAGFTVETSKLEELQKSLEKLIEKVLDENLLQRVLKIDCELPLEYISQDLYDTLQNFSPFGMGNPEPSFVARDVVAESIRTVGKESNHLKLELGGLHAISFGMGELAKKIKVGSNIDIVYTIDENVWRDKKNLQLKIKDIRLN